MSCKVKISAFSVAVLQASFLAVILGPLIATAQNQSPSMEFIIKVREAVPMQQLANQAQATGVSFTPAQIKELVAPKDEQYQILLQQIQQEGFQIVRESPSHLFITVRGQNDNVERLFQTRISQNSNGRKPMIQPSIPSYLPLIDSIVGLNTVRKMKPRLMVSNVQSTAGINGASDSASDVNVQGGKLPSEIKSVYGLNDLYKSGLSGKGQDIAIATYDGLNLDDVQQYYQKIGLTDAPKVDAINFNGTAKYSADSAMETELDVEFSGMIAPGAAIHVFTSAENSDAGELGLFTAILDDNRAKIVNYSWGSCELELDPAHKLAMDSVYARAVAQGVNITVASGDSGSNGCTDQPQIVSADYPASNPNVIAVGGTTLVESGQTFEEAWSNSGGGISTLYDLPDYQRGLGGVFQMRSMPDVAFNADPKTGEAAFEHVVDKQGNVSSSAQWLTLGGTSIAAPQWAGYLALVNEARAKNSLGPIGFLNPIIYALSGNDQAQDFNDVVVGSNGKYSCATGYDAVTGFGSMKGANLFSALTTK